MKVTALKQQSRNKNRVNVYLDDQFAFGLAKIEAVRLRIGQELTQADLARLKAADGVEQAHERALRFLGVRPRSEAEVRQRLRQQGVDEAILEEVLERLRRAGLVDDQAFANYWIENRTTFRPKSKRAMLVELRRKGVAAEVLDEALSASDDSQAAYDVARKRAPRLAKLPEPDFRRKLSEFLGRRGFSYDIIEPVLERVWKELQESVPPT
jgi:regulatory protein